MFFQSSKFIIKILTALLICGLIIFSQTSAQAAEANQTVKTNSAELTSIQVLQTNNYYKNHINTACKYNYCLNVDKDDSFLGIKNQSIACTILSITSNDNVINNANVIKVIYAETNLTNSTISHQPIYLIGNKVYEENKSLTQSFYNQSGLLIHQLKPYSTQIICSIFSVNKDDEINFITYQSLTIPFQVTHSNDEISF